MATTEPYLDNVEEMARQIIKVMGKRSAGVVRQQAETVAALGDTISARVWFDVVDAIDRIQGTKRPKTAA